MSQEVCEMCEKKLTIWNRAWGTNKCSYCAKGKSPGWESSPWASKGVLWWAGLIIFYVIYNVYEGFKRGDVTVVLALPLCGAISVALCVWWYNVSKRRRRRGKVLRTLGYIVFYLGSLTPISYVIYAGLSFGTNRVPSGLGLVLAFVQYLLLVAGLIAGAYYLVFRSDEKATCRCGEGQIKNYPDRRDRG